MNSGWEISAPDRRVASNGFGGPLVGHRQSFYRLTKFRAEISVDGAISSNQFPEVQDVC